MNAFEKIRAAQTAKLIDEDGETVCIELSQRLSPLQIDALENEIGLPLPAELRLLLTECSGFDGCLAGIDFTGRSFSFEHKELFPHGLPIASDGFGNFWVLDITPSTSSSAPIFFACHDAPVVLYQSPDIASFLTEVFRMSQPPHQSLVNDVHEDRLFDVWGRNPGIVDLQAALNSTDVALRTFAASLPVGFQIIDLRDCAIGNGFSWGRYGPRTLIRRFGHERIFAYSKPPATGFFSKLFGTVNQRPQA